MQEFGDLMLDFETLGTRPDSIVLSVGACLFNPRADGNGLGPTFYEVLDQSEQVGRTVNGDTVKWWHEQSPEARAVLDAPGLPVGVVLTRLTAFMEQAEGGAKAVRIWGNGSDFDCSMLVNLFSWHGSEQRWSHLNHRCFRTLKNLSREDYESAKAKASAHEHHNALGDARWQAEVAVRMLRKQAAARARPLCRGVGAERERGRLRLGA